jgi:pimeloyl-ACP methyl ester carboxylesterase
MAAEKKGSVDFNMTKVIRVSHLGGIEAGYRISGPYKQYKPTLILINSFTTSAELYQSQFENTKLTETMNILAIEPLGHGKTKLRTPGRETFTYWDSAIMAIQVMDALGIKKAFALGTSQGGWIVTRMALVAPERIAGIIPLGTSLDYESERTRKLGCWNGPNELESLVKDTTSKTPTESFEPSNEYCDFIVDIGFGKDCPSDKRQLWHELVKRNYQGDAGRKRMREAAINLRERDGLHGRLTNVTCPVLWLHGDADAVYSVDNAKEEIKLLDSSPDAKLLVVKGGHHFLSSTHPQEVDTAVLEFVTKHSQSMKTDVRALREAVGMVEM